MTYLLRTLIGLGLIAGACTVVAYSAHGLVEIGNCATGAQPVALALECSEGFERPLLAIFAAMPVLGLGAMLHAGRGRSPGSKREPVTSTLLLIWSGIFGGIAFAALWAAWGPDADPAGGGGVGTAARFAGISIGIAFALVAFVAIVLLIARALEERRAPAAAAPYPPRRYSVAPIPPASGSPVGAAAQVEVPPGSPSDSEHDAELERLRRRLVEDD